LIFSLGAGNGSGGAPAAFPVDCHDIRARAASAKPESGGFHVQFVIGVEAPGPHDSAVRSKHLSSECALLIARTKEI
jgi:hypothetical protein